MEPSINKAEHYNSIGAVYLVAMGCFLVLYSKSLGHILIRKLVKSDSMTLKINSVCQSGINAIGKKLKEISEEGKFRLDDSRTLHSRATSQRFFCHE